MREITFQPGELIYREGDRPDCGYIILAGEVEVGREGSLLPPRLLHRGESFGDIEIILNSRRGNTARAAGVVAVTAVDRAEFLAAMEDNQGIAVPVLSRLFRALHQAPEVTPAAAPLLDLHAGPAIRLLPASENIQGQLGADGVTVSATPFRVGRKPNRGESLPPGGLELMLRDDRPYNLSRQHFCLEVRGGVAVVRDTGSHLGTIVNDTPIGGDAMESRAPLRTGENRIVAGRRSSPFAFLAVVGPD